jgi:hypothetical protein
MRSSIPGTKILVPDSAWPGTRRPLPSDGCTLIVGVPVCCCTLIVGVAVCCGVLATAAATFLRAWSPRRLPARLLAGE